MKILHCSDIHLGRRPLGPRSEYSDLRFSDYYKVFLETIEDAVKKNVDIMLISGDLFDRKELIPEVLERTENLFKILKDNNITVILIEGNHDNITNGREYDSWILYLEKKGYLKRPSFKYENDNYIFTPITIKGINFYGAGYPGCLINETLRALADYLKNQEDKNNIILVHTAIADTNLLPGTVERSTIDCLKGHCIYIAGGHFHSYSAYPESDPYFFIPGSLEYWDIAEKSDGKGYIIYDTESKKHLFFPSNPRKKTIINITFEGDGFEELKKSLINNGDKQKIHKGEEILFIRIKLKKSFYIDTTWIEEYFLSRGALKVIVKIEYPGLTQENYGNYRTLGTEDAEYELISGWEFVGDKKEETFEALRKMKIYQKERNETLFIEEMEKMIDSLIK